MQDYFMNNAMKGYPEDKHIYVCAHYEKTNDNDGTVTYQMKTTGKMVNEYCTPQGKFDIILYGKQTYNEEEKKAIKTFVKDFDGTFPAKDSIGVLDNMPDEFPNDLFLVSEELKKWYN